MGKIHILPQELVNRIAAGEVVEKPASIVKELLDNSFDAQANQITIEIEEGGINKIHIVDNGSGMDLEDAKLAFQAHATSKISNDDDLLNIKSFGFRGEALSSIAAVSKVTLKTRTSQANLATEIIIEGGDIIHTGETGGAVGTSILIEDLFYNVPARKEFLRAAASEYKDILEVVNAHAMAKPEVGITLINNGRTVFNFPKNHQLEDRVREILGNDYYEKLIPLFYEHPHLEIYGFVGKPELASDRKKHQYIFVNKRNIENKSISFAAKDAYGSLIMKNTYPVFIIFIDVAPNIVDVNVHPRKEEVKFTNDHLIFDSVKNAVKKSLDRANLTPGSLPGGVQPMTPPNMPNQMPPQGFPRSPYAPPSNGMPQSPFNRPMPSPFARPAQQPGAMPSVFDSPFRPQPKTPQQTENLWDKLPWEDDGEDETTDTNKIGKSPLKVLAVHHLYFVTESEEGIIIYDQHAVHERILYEKLTKKHEEDNIENSAQPLLTPIVANLSMQEAEVIKDLIPQLEEIGFKLEEFGPNTYKITQVPVVMQKVDIKSLLHELIEDLQHDDKSIDAQTNKILTYLSCRLAYKGGDTIPLEEVNELISKLDTMDNKFTCPHGRPVKVEITLKELSKMFKRTV